MIERGEDVKERVRVSMRAKTSAGRACCYVSPDKCDQCQRMLERSVPVLARKKSEHGVSRNSGLSHPDGLRQRAAGGVA